MAVYELTLPLDDATVEKLQVGDIIYLNLKTVESTLSQIRRRRARGTSGLWPSSP